MLNVGDIIQEKAKGGVKGTVIASFGNGAAIKYMVQFGKNPTDHKWVKERDVTVVTHAVVKPIVKPVVIPAVPAPTKKK